MRAWQIALAALVLCVGQARGQASGWSYTGVAENDVFNYSPTHTDRYYTHGTQISGASPPIDYKSLPWLVRLPCLLEESRATCDRLRAGESITEVDPDLKIRWGLELGQNIYTPASKDPIPDPKDRPYAGWAYGGLSFGSYSKTQSNSLELQLGLVGPSSGAAWVQDNFHDLIRAARFQGWNHQLRDEVAFVVLGERRWAPRPIWPPGANDGAGWAIDTTPHVDFALGTVQDSVSVGDALRIGYGLNADYGPPRIRPAPSGSTFIMQESNWSAYVFAGLDGRAVAHDIFLDGNTFLNSPHVDKRWLVWEATSGAALRWRGVRLAYTHVWQSEEFLGQRGPQEFGSWSVTLLPCAFWKGCAPVGGR
jgi:lipid A 3-O-deacylase